MRTIIEPSRRDWGNLCKRPELDTASLNKTVENVFNAISLQGDDAIRHYTRLFDKADIGDLLVNEEEWSMAEQISDQLKQAIRLAEGNIHRFHAAQYPEKKVIQTTKGVYCWQESKPVEKIGIYIPGGTAPLFSTVLMLAIPARIAGCKEVVLCTPPDSSGNIHPAVLFSARLTGVTKIVKAGGIQAIAGLTFGTASIPKVHKIFGPGNQYVQAAKQRAFQEGIAIDMPAGPSELLVLADDSAQPGFVAADLLSQAEHGPDSQVVCIVDNGQFLNKIKSEVSLQIKKLPRASIAEQAMRNSRFILIQNKEDSLEFINTYAPEHLIICTKENDYYVRNICNAGSVFIGNYSPESAGDYASGTNHTLPTNGFAKAYSGINLDAFTKKITFQEITQEGLTNIGPAIATMAAAENLQAHKNAITIRLNTFDNEI